MRIPASARPTPRSGLRPAALCSITLMALVLSPRLPAAKADPSIIYRSTRSHGDARIDELQMPQPGVRACHRGWEVRTRHLVVFSTVSARQARWAAAQMERAFEDIGKMADHWTNVHRQPTFGIGAIGVTITDTLGDPRARPANAPDKLDYDANIFVDLSDGPERLEERLPQLRRDLFHAFLRVAQQDQVLPDWVQVGMADYFANPTAPIAPPATLSAPLPAAGPSVGVWDRRTASDSMGPLVENRRAARLWVRYLLEGDDARCALELFDAMAATVRSHPQDPFHPAAGVGGVRRSTVRRTSPGAGPLEALVNAELHGRRLGAWMKDPQIGQPLIQTEAEGTAIGLPQREMAMILKLNRRFGGASPATISPKVIRPGTGGARPRTAVVANPIDLDSLYRRLTNPAGPPWATLDADGRLLFSSETQRIAKLFRGGRYRVVQRDGRHLLETTLPGGKVLEAWMEENPEDHLRPIVHIRERYSERASSRPASLAQKTARPTTE